MSLALTDQHFTTHTLHVNNTIDSLQALHNNQKGKKKTKPNRTSEANDNELFKLDEGTIGKKDITGIRKSRVVKLPDVH